MSRPAPPTYKTRNWPAYSKPVGATGSSPPAHALKRRGALTIWFDPEMSWEAAPTGRRGRRQSYSDTAIQTCLTMKGEGRLGNRPVACFSPERAEPRAVRHGAPADDRVCRALVAAGWSRLDGSRRQHAVSSHCPAGDLHRKSAQRGQKTLDVNIP